MKQRNADAQETMRAASPILEDNYWTLGWRESSANEPNAYAVPAGAIVKPARGNEARRKEGLLSKKLKEDGVACVVGDFVN